jgi:uncharacterized protein
MSHLKSTSDLSQLSAFLASEQTALRPLEMWNPPYCGMMDLTIQANGIWMHEGTPINRPELVKLFASVLWREKDRYFLKSPVEKIGITVEDLPFQAVDLQMTQENGHKDLLFRTNVDDVVRAGADHPLSFKTGKDGQMRPALLVRRNLFARVTRTLYYELVEMGETRLLDQIWWFGICSGGCFFPMIEADALAHA